MIITLLQISLLLLAAAYAGVLWGIARSWRRQVAAPLAAAAQETNLPLLTVLIPARNEAAGIEQCIHAVLAQDYPRELLEVIVIDDHSTDTTAALVTALADDRVQLLRLSDIPGSPTGKKAALQAGIDQGRGAFIVTTDADCRAPAGWLRAFARARAQGYEMVLAPVSIAYSPGLLTAWQGLDVAGTMLLTGAAAASGKPLLANGANFGFTPTFFAALGGYTGNDHRASGDDLFLLQKAVAQRPAALTFLYVAEALVTTAAAPTWCSLFWQRLRWAAKTTAYRDRRLVAFQAAVYLLCASLCLGLAVAWWFPGVCAALLASWLIKLGADFFFLRYACRQVGDRRWLRWFLLAQPLHTGYVFLVGSLALLPIHFYWKGRRVK
ncbi:MAG: hypothetical protein DA408_08100 [Bacteroidetes bacterium]|nr:MAG: hypothetical protein C7N36_05760 [Bacteroidota bacterium]PTM13032.1 MAG: hypothetical protein DA408_08100 [Bacteroidota bacterium]